MHNAIANLVKKTTITQYNATVDTE